MGKFTLINPVILGNVETTSNADTDINAAKEIWDNLSKHINNNIPLFLFTLKGGSMISHFSVKENIKNKDKKIEYLIEKIYPALDNAKESKYVNKATSMFDTLKKYQSGGKRSKSKGKNKSSDSSSSSSDSDTDSKSYYSYLKLKNNSPIRYWWYTPSFYQYERPVLFTPTFKTTVVPYIQWEIL